MDLSAQMQLFDHALSPSDVVYTPDWVARDMVAWFNPTGRVLEPCRGDDAIYRHLPGGSEWCEIACGRDFFAWNQPVDWIITNPPYSLMREFMQHSFDLSVNTVFLQPLHTFFRAGGLIAIARKAGFVKHVRLYGGGHKLGFPTGNPIAAIHFQRNYHGDTSWSWYEP